MTALDRRDVEDIYALSPLQAGMLFHAVYAPTSGVDLVQTLYLLEGSLDEDALLESWRRIVARHPALRASFAWQGLERPVQVVRRRVEVSFQRLDWRSASPEEQEAALERYLQEDRDRGFELDEAPLLRLALAQTGEREHRLVWTFHHALVDGWSTSIVEDELMTTYAALRRGEQPSLAAPPPYRRYVEWLRSLDRNEAAAYWGDALAGLEAPTRIGFERPTAERGAGLVETELSGEETAALEATARRLRLTPSALVTAAWAILLSAYGGDDDIVFGTTVSGRSGDVPGIESMVGLFINTLPLRVQVAGNETATALLRSVQDRLLELQQLEHSSLADVREWSAIPGDVPLFESIFVFQNHPAPAAGAPDAGLVLHPRGTFEDTGFPITVLASLRERLTLGILYDRSRIERGSVERLLDRFGRLVRGLVADPEARVRDLELVGEDERRRVALEWNATAASYPREPSVASAFEAQVRRTPDAVALVDGDERLTYRELNVRANRLARRLREHGVGPEALVGLCVERGAAMVAAVLAVLKAGGAYVPLDPAYPSDRLRFMVEDAGARVVVAEDRFLDRLAAESATVLPPEVEDGDVPDEDLPPFAEAGSLAYVVYTSGSTGAPKGVAVEHRAVLNTLWWLQETFGLGPEDVVAQKTPASFTDSIWEILWPLLVGSRLAVLDDDVVRDPELLLRGLREEGVTYTQFVPPLMRAFLETVRREAEPNPLPALRWVFNGGEALPAPLAREWYDAFPEARIANIYGMTESAIYATISVVEPDPDGRVRVLVGRPIGNERAYVVDRHGRPAASETPGEIHLGGTSLARGYLGRPALTAERFVPDPFSGEPGARLYRTGDLGRHLPDGEIEYLGRADSQVKVRGLRVELGEVEAALARHEAVAAAAVVPREDEPGERQLVAYVVLAPGREASTSDLRAFLGRTLPDYMLPTAFVPLDSLPLGPNGKVDRRRLAAPDGTRPELERPFVAPRGAIEEAVAEIWADLLRLDRVGAHDDFFHLGGHSLLAMRVAGRIHDRLGLDLPLRTLFEEPTVAKLAAAIAAQSTGREPDTGTTHPAPLVPISDFGEGSPFFCIHHGGGDVLSYVQLAQLLQPARPFYGLRVPSLDGVVPPLVDLPTMAERYAEAIRSVQPSGPYHLGGWSFGGVAAFEIAGLLLDEGEEVGVVALFDSPVPSEEAAERSRGMRAELKRLADLTERTRDVEPWPPAWLRSRYAAMSSYNFRPAAFQDGPDGLLRIVHTIVANARAFEEYEPRFYPGTLSLFVASEEGWADRLASEWAEHAVDVRSHLVSGTHLGLVEEPGVRELARILGTELAQADRPRITLT